MRRVSCVRYTAALLTTTILSSQALAEEPASSSTLDTVTVYATKSEQSTFDVPVMVNSIDAEAPGTALSNDTEGLLKMTPGVDVINGPRSNGQTVTIRGFDSEAIITLMDGRRQNFEAAHDGRFYFDPLLLKRVEVVKGASSSIYGGGGIGGVVAFETKDASDLLKPGQSIGAIGTFGGRTANEEISTSASVYGRTGNLDLLGSLSLRSSGDIRDGDGEDLSTDEQIVSGLFKAGYTIGDWHTVKFQYQGFQNDGQEPNNPAGGIGTSNPVVDKLVDDHQFSLRYEYDNPTDELLNLKIHAYRNDTEVEETDISGTNAGRVQVRELNTTGLTIDNQSLFDISDSHSHTFSYGVEIYRDVQEGFSTATVDGSRPGVPEAKALTWGAYVQDEIKFDTAAGQFLIIPAVRFDQYRSDDDAGNSQNESAVSPKIALSYKPTENFVLFGSVAQAFRAPNMTELYPSGQHFPAIPPMFPANNFVPNPDLKPETVTTFELGAGVNFQQIATRDDELRVKGAWHYSKGEDFIAQDVDIFAGTTENYNVDNARLWGFEVEGDYRISQFSFKTGLSYVEAEDEDTGEYLGNNVPLTFTTDVSYLFTDISSTLGWRARYADENDHASASEQTAGYGVHDIYYRFAPTEGDLQNLSLDLAVENVFDKYYTKRFAALPEEGVNFAARVRIKW